MMKIALLILTVALTLVIIQGQNRGKSTDTERQTDANAERMLDEGKQTFRFDTFGDEASVARDKSRTSLDL